MFTKAPISSSVALLFIAGLAVTGCDDSTVPPPEETGDPETTASESQSDIDFPTNAEDYADALVEAWGDGDEPAMKDLAAPQAVDTLESYAMPDNTDWEQTESDSDSASEDGIVMVTYEEATYGTVLELEVNDELASDGQPYAVTGAEVSEAIKSGRTLDKVFVAAGETDRKSVV